MASNNFQAVLHTLCEGGVAFVLVGGLAAILQGADMGAMEVEILPERAEDNLTKLLRVLESIDAV